MTEPKATASSVEEVAEGVWRWAIHDERIDFLSAAYAVTGDEGTVLIDPLPLASEALAEVGDVKAICLTCGSHQRSAWRYRRELGAKVYAPGLASSLEEDPDQRYGDGDLLPGGLRAVFTPGAGTTQHTLVREGEPGVAFCPDLFLLPPGGRLDLVPAEYMHEPDEAMRSAEKLLGLSFSILCLTHGSALTDDPKTEVRAALAARA